MKGLLSLSDNSIMSTIDKIRSNCYGYRITMLRDLTFSVLFWTALESYRNYRVEN